MDNKKFFGKKLLFAGLAFIAFLLFWSFLNLSLQRTRATGDQVNVVISPKTETIAAGAPYTINVLINATNQKKISGIDLNIKAQGKIKIVDVGPVVAVGSTATFSQIIKEVASAQARATYVSTQATAELPQSISLSVKIQPTDSAGVGTLSIDQSASQIVGTAAGKVFAWGAVDEGQYTVSSSLSPTVTPIISQAPSVTLKFEPQETNVSLGGQEFNTAFRIVNAPVGKKITGFSTIIKYPQDLVDITVSDPLEDNGANSTKFIQLKKEVKTDVGEIHLTYVSQLPQAQLADNVRVVIHGRGKTTGTGQLQITQPQITGNIPENAYHPIVQNGTITVGDGISTTPGGNLVLNLQVRFQGIVVKPANSQSMRVAVKLANQVSETPYAYATFTPDENGVWSGSVSMNVSPGDGYRLYVKGPKHLQKKVCVINPSETAAGTYRCSDGKLTVQGGARILDLSGIVFLVGDLPEQGAVGQNGVVDAYDVSFVRNNLGSVDPAVLAVGDLNLDGIVDTQDFSLIIASLSVKYDEE